MIETIERVERVERVEHRDELECRETGWLVARRAELVQVQRRARAEELAIVAVLDQRGALDPGAEAQSGVSARVARDTVETARALDALPAIARAAAEGQLSEEQLAAVTQLADETTDAEWAERARNCSPSQLQRLVDGSAPPPPRSPSHGTGPVVCACRGTPRTRCCA